MKKKRIIIFVVIALSVLSIIFIGMIISKNSSMETQKIAEHENVIDENPITEEIAESTNESQEDNSEVSNENNEEITTNKEQTTEEKKTQETGTSKSTAQSQATNNKQTTATVKTPVASSSQGKVATSTGIAPTTTTPTTTQKANNNTESFKINNSIINKMRSIINANPSNYMKQFGYNIVVDSSIVNQTTGFTYTDTRVKNAISNSFGTIRIYARDYYVGNELRWTEGFIL